MKKACVYLAFLCDRKDWHGPGKDWNEVVVK